MASGWQGSDRRSRLPANWPALRKATFRRDGYRCTALDQDGDRCTERATDCDHIKPGDDHRQANLTSLCGPHHRVKSGREGAAAKAVQWKRNDKKFRRVEEHPGLL